jgi:hypothetical protein
MKHTPVEWFARRAFKRNDRYYIGTTKFIADEYIIKVEKM